MVKQFHGTGLYLDWIKGMARQLIDGNGAFLCLYNEGLMCDDKHDLWRIVCGEESAARYIAEKHFRRQLWSVGKQAHLNLKKSIALIPKL